MLTLKNKSKQMSEIYKHSNISCVIQFPWFHWPTSVELSRGCWAISPIFIHIFRRWSHQPGDDRNTVARLFSHPLPPYCFAMHQTSWRYYTCAMLRRSLHNHVQCVFIRSARFSTLSGLVHVWSRTVIQDHDMWSSCYVCIVTSVLRIC